MRSIPVSLPSTTVAIVTGGSRGIGFAIASALAELGTTVVITGRDARRLDTSAGQLRSLGLKCEGVVCDVANLDSVTTLSARLRENYPRVDILVNNAGIGSPSSLLHELDPADWDTIFHTNVRGVFFMMRAVVP